MSNRDLAELFHDLTQNPPPSRYLPESIQPASRRRRRRRFKIAAVGAVVCASVSIVAVANHDESRGKAPTSNTTVVPWKPLTPGPTPGQDARTPLLGEPVSVTFSELPEYKSGQDRYEFVVRLTNGGTQAVDLSPCPFYRIQFSRELETGYLNCGSAPKSIPAGGYVDFAMSVPAWPILNGPQPLMWQLGYDDVEGARESATVPFAARTATDALDCGHQVPETLAESEEYENGPIACMTRAYESKQAAEVRLYIRSVEGGVIVKTYHLHPEGYFSLITDARRDAFRGPGPAINTEPCVNPRWFPHASCGSIGG